MPMPIYRIAVAIPKYGLTGGAEGFAAELCKRIARHPRYEIHVFANRWTGDADPITFHKVPIISFPKFLTTISFAWFARRRISGMAFNLVHAQDRLLEADIFTMHGIPHRLWVKDVRKKTMSLYDHVTDWVERELVKSKRCRYFLAVSNLVKEKFLQAYLVDPLMVKVVSPGVDAARFDNLDREQCRREIRGSLGIGADDTVILFVSMNFEVKGLDRLVMALARWKSANPGGKFKLLVVGKGNARKYLALAGKLNVADRIIFAGVMDKTGLDRAYLASDIFSILSRFDTFGMVVLEAMAASLPVMISSNVGAKDLVCEGVNGFVIEDKADDAVIAGKIGLLMERRLQEKMGAAARRTACENTWEAAAEKVLAVYEEALQSLVSSQNSRNEANPTAS